MGATAAMLTAVALVASRHAFSAAPDPDAGRTVMRAGSSSSRSSRTGWALSGSTGSWPTARTPPLRRPRDRGGARRSEPERVGASRLQDGSLVRPVDLHHGCRRGRVPDPRAARAVAVPPAPGARDRELARSLVASWGVDTLAPFVLRADKSYFFGERDRAFLAYRVVGARRDRIGGSDRAAGAPTRSSSGLSSSSRVRATGGSRSSAHPSGCLDLYRSEGCTRFNHGDRGDRGLERFSSRAGRSGRFRQSVHRLQSAASAPRSSIRGDRARPPR
jgi:hypothetical protein